MLGSVFTNGRSLVAALFSLAFVAALAAPTPALAGDGAALTKYLPGDSNFAARIDVDGLEQSKYYDRAVEYLKEQGNEAVANILEGSEGFDVRSDLDAAAMGLPVARVSSSRDLERATLAVSGDFEKSDIVDVLKEEYSELSTRELDGGATLYTAGNRGFVVPTSGRLVAAIGPKSYRKGVWRLLEGDGTSFAKTADDEGLLVGVDTDRTLWMVNRISKRLRGPATNAKSVAVAVELASGVDLQVVTRADKKSNAKSMVKRVKAMKKTGRENAMLRMFGAGPLIENLEVERDGTSVVATTSMSESELDYLIEQVRQFSQKKSTLSIPSSKGTKSPPSSKQSGDDKDNGSEEGNDGEDDNSK